MTMPQYRMHTNIEAAKIVFCTTDQIHVQIGETVVGVDVSRETIDVTKPEPGEYLVKHIDGTFEVMAAAEFEAYFAPV